MYKIVGYNPVSFTDQQSGELVEGVTFHLVSDQASSSIKNGCEVVQKFFSNNKIFGTPQLGASAELKFTVSSGKPKITGIEISK